MRKLEARLGRLETRQRVSVRPLVDGPSLDEFRARFEESMRRQEVEAARRASLPIDEQIRLLQAERVALRDRPPPNGAVASRQLAAVIDRMLELRIAELADQQGGTSGNHPSAASC